jgi:Trp operon repressor
MINVIKWILFAIFIFVIAFASDENKNENEDKDMLASQEAKEQIISYFLNTKEKEKLIEYLIKENEDKKETVLQLTSRNGYDKILKLLLNSFGIDQNKKLIAYLMKKDEEIIKLLFDAIDSEDKEKLIKCLMKENEDKKENRKEKN